MKKRLLTMILVGALSGAMLAGCGSEPVVDEPDTEYDDFEEDDDDYGEEGFYIF